MSDFKYLNIMQWRNVGLGDNFSFRIEMLQFTKGKAEKKKIVN
jgi:hypothetical protein